MIRWTLVVCLAAFWLLSSMGQQNGSNNRNTVSNTRHDVRPSVANSKAAKMVGNNTMVRKVNRSPVKRKIFRELLQEFVTFKKNIWPILMGKSNTSSLRIGNQQTHRQFINMIGDFRFIRTEILFLKTQNIILIENVTDARRDHKLLSEPLGWVVNNMTELKQAMEAIAVYMSDCHRVCAPTVGVPQTAAGELQKLSVLIKALQKTNEKLGQVNVSVTAGTKKISGEILEVREILRFLGQDVYGNKEHIIAGVGKLEQSIVMSHNFLASNISELSSHLVNHAAAISTLPPNLLDAVNQISQAINEIGKIVTRIDNSMSSGLVDMQLRMNDMLNTVNTAASGVSSLRSEVAAMRVDLNIIKEAARFNGPGNGNEVPAGTVPPAIPAPPALPYPTLPIYPVYPSAPPPFPHPGGGVPEMHMPGILPTAPRPMWPGQVQQQQQHIRPLHPAQFPTGPHGPGLPIGFANRFTGYCACTCPCPCICPIMDLGPHQHTSFANNSAWPFSPHGTHNYGITGDCFCLCTCTCPRFLGISDQYYPAAGPPPFGSPPIESPAATEPPQNGDSQQDSILPSLLDFTINTNTAGMVVGALQELLKLTRLVRGDLGQMQSATKRDQESSRQDLKDHLSKTLDYFLRLVHGNYEENMKMINDLANTVLILQTQVQQSSSKSTRSLDVISTNFSKFYKDISALILSPSTLLTDRLTGHYPFAGSSLGLQPPELNPPGGSTDYSAGGQSIHEENSTTSPEVPHSSTPNSKSRNSQQPSEEDNRTNAVGQRMLPIQLEDPSQGASDFYAANKIERDSISQRESGIIEGCGSRPAEQYAPLVIAPGVAYPFVPNLEDETSLTDDDDDDYDVEDAGETAQEGSWGIRYAMALPVRRMLNGDILAIHDLLHKHINNHLINVLQSNPVLRPHRTAKRRRPKWHQQRRPKPSKPWKRGYRIVRLPAKPSSLLAAASSAQRLPASGLPLILSQHLGHVPPRITMPGIAGPFPYSMSYNDGQGNSFSININRRNYPLMRETYRSSAGSGKKRLCRFGKK